MGFYCSPIPYLNSSLREQNGRHFADDIFKCFYMKQNLCILVRILLKFVSKSPIDSKPTLVQIISWRWTGDKPLSETIVTKFTNAYMRH